MSNNEQLTRPEMNTGDQKTAFQLPIHFIKSTCFRVIHANGVWYGGDNQRNLHLTFFNERNPIPKTMVVKLDEHGEVVGEDISKRDSRHGMVREMEVDIVLSVPVALELYKSLGENLKAIQALAKLSPEEKLKALHESIKHEPVVSK
jgi:hypothetical protein